uniref:Uncharacterized protein n=1 Tax=Salix viminalis TaxID=40686 RepID=A0A6N2KKW8_SALVM
MLPFSKPPLHGPYQEEIEALVFKTLSSQVSSFTTFFQSLNLLNNETKVLCVSAGAEHEEMALNNMGVSDRSFRRCFVPFDVFWEMERTVRNGGVCVVVVEECG